jgi:CRISPR-associated protein Cas2
MKGYGEPLQYSVFVCDLSRAEKSAMQLHLGTIIDHGEDSIAILDLGEVTDSRIRFEYMGVHRPLPAGGPTVV